MVSPERKILNLQKKLKKYERAISRLKNGSIDLDDEDLNFFESVKVLVEPKVEDRSLQEVINRRPDTEQMYYLWYKIYKAVNFYHGVKEIIKKEKLEFKIVLTQEHQIGGGWEYEYQEVPLLSRLQDLSTDSFDYVYLELLKDLGDQEIIDSMNRIQDKVEEESEERVMKVIKLIEVSHRIRDKVKEIEKKHNVVMGV